MENHIHYVYTLLNRFFYHSFVFGGDYPSVEKNTASALGADLVLNNGQWQVKRIYNTESWNPSLSAPLAQPDLKIEEGNYILAIDDKTLSADIDPYQLLNGKASLQTTLLVNNKSWKKMFKYIISTANRSKDFMLNCNVW